MSQNKNIVLVMGKPNTGKSTSLMKLKNQEKMAYLNADLKELPFRSKFAVNVEIKDAYDVLDFIDEIEQEAGIEGGVLDTITFLMEMFESFLMLKAKLVETGVYSIYEVDQIADSAAVLSPTAPEPSELGPILWFDTSMPGFSTLKLVTGD